MAGEADSVVRVCSKSEVAPGSVKAFAVGLQHRRDVLRHRRRMHPRGGEPRRRHDRRRRNRVLHAHGLVPYPDRHRDAAACEVPLRTYQVVLTDEDVFAVPYAQCRR